MSRETDQHADRDVAPPTQGPKVGHTGRNPGGPRCALSGTLMGLAMLVPGVSGGTMILVCGIYEEFVSAIADVTRLKFTRPGVSLLAIVGTSAGLAIVLFAGVLSQAVKLHPSAMFSIFIGLTLGGVPRLIRMIGQWTPRAACGAAVGLLLMVAMVMGRTEPPDKHAKVQAVELGQLQVRPAYGLDLTAGILGMSAMVLPGVSGAYMFLILGRYEPILSSISVAKKFVFSGGGQGAWADFLPVLIPVAIGCLASLLLFSNLLKWLLHRYPQVTIGCLLGIVLGSVIGIWPFHAESSINEILVGVSLAVGGFLVTASLARIGS